MALQQARSFELEDYLKIIMLRLEKLEDLPRKVENMTKEITELKNRVALLEHNVYFNMTLNKKKEEVVKVDCVPVQVDANNGNSRSKHQKEFTKVLEKIKLTNSEKCIKVLQIVLPQVITRMKNANPLFGRMYRCNVYTGSFYEKLRIKDACEFDINLVLDLPASSGQIKVDASVNPPSYALLHLEQNVADLAQLSDAEKRCLTSLLEDGYVIPAKLLSWIQGVIDNARLKEITAEGVKRINMTASGPARTLLVILNDGTEISVDLVPVFKFPFKDWPKEIRNLRTNFVNQVTTEEKKSLYLVPKAYKAPAKKSSHEPKEKDKNRIWRMHFADIERDVLEKNIDARPVIRLLKLLRDSQNWKNVHSYFLKTLVLNEIATKPQTLWKQDLIAVRLLEMLKCLERCLEKRKLPHFFFQTVNLFQYINEAEAVGMKNRLNTIIKKISEEADQVSVYFKV